MAAGGAGGWRGDAVTHGELGIGSWAKGKAQSTLTLLPLFLFEGDDSAENLRNRLIKIAASYNRLKRRGTLTVCIGGRNITVPIKMLAAADFQFFKAIMNMSKYTSALWCCCQLPNLFRRPDAEAEMWDDVLAFYASIGCKLKDLETICELNHWSFEVLEGRPFKPFSCRCGYRSGPERQWRAEVEEHAQLEGSELKAADLEHSSQPQHCRHKPLQPPLLHQGAIDNSADTLHLIFINMFAFKMEHTMFIYVNEWEEKAREPFELYLRHIGIPAKVVKAQNVTEMKQSLTGRDAKVVLAKALEHIPALLEFVHAGQDAVVEEVEAPAPAPAAARSSDEDFDWGGDEDDAEEQAADGGADAEPRILQDAKA